MDALGFPDTVVIKTPDVVEETIEAYLYPYSDRVDDGFYDTDATVPNPTMIMTDSSHRRKFTMLTEVEHTHNNGVELDPHIFYFVAALPKNFTAGGVFKDTDCTVVLLGENRPNA